MFEAFTDNELRLLIAALASQLEVGAGTEIDLLTLDEMLTEAYKAADSRNGTE